MGTCTSTSMNEFQRQSNRGRVSRRKPIVAKVIDLFSGAGLFAYSFANEGFTLVQSVELNSTAASTHHRNLRSPIVVDDVRSQRPQAVCDVLIAGPPCQGFSTLGRRDPLDAR